MGNRLRLPVLCELPAPPSGAGAAQLRRVELAAFERLLDGLERLGGPRVVLIASGAGSGATRVAAGLATAAALAGERVMLMDCDMPAPALAADLGLAPLPGLREYLAYEAEAPQILQPLELSGPAVAGGRAGTVVCVTAGRPAANGAALLASDGFQRALGKIRKGYGLVLLRAPALAAAEIPPLHDLAEALLVCIERGERSGAAAAAVDAALLRLRPRPAGLVVAKG